MNWIGGTRKKEIPDEVKVKRGKIILIVMTVVIAIIVFVPGHKQKKVITESPIEERMNLTVDSLIKSMGYNDYEIFYTGEIETMEETVDCPEKDMLASVDTRINMITAMTAISEQEKIKRLDEALAEKKVLQEKIKEFEENQSQITYYSRRIRFSVPEGQQYTFFQQVCLNPAFERPKYFREITKTNSNAHDELNRITKESK